MLNLLRGPSELQGYAPWTQKNKNSEDREKKTKKTLTKHMFFWFQLFVYLILSPVIFGHEILRCVLFSNYCFCFCLPAGVFLLVLKSFHI